MKKIFSTLMVIGLAFLTIACVNLDNIKSNYEEAGYDYSEDGSAWISGLLSSFEKNGVIIQVHVFTRGINTAIILEFETDKELKKQLDENDTLKGLITDLDDADLVRGNFLLIPISLSSSSITEIIDIFNGRYKPETTTNLYKLNKTITIWLPSCFL